MLARLRDAQLLLKASVDLVRVDMILQRNDLHPTLHRWNNEFASTTAAITAQDIRDARRYARRIAQAARISRPRMQCLHRSMVLHRWLRREGLPSELRIGVRKDGDALQAHAWVELGAHVVNDRLAAVMTFTRLPLGTSLATTDTQRTKDVRRMQWW